MLDLLEEIAECLNHPRMYSFLHVPVQSGSDAVLSRMVREYSAADFATVCDEMLKRVPGLQLATDIIVGFPGETEEEFEETMALLRKYRFAVCNISQFYPRPGTPAARMPRVPTQLVKERSRRLSELFNSGIEAPYRALQGTRQRVWVTETAHDKHNLCGHTKSYAQVIVDPAEARLGTDLICDIVDASGRFFVRGRRVSERSAWSRVWIVVAVLIACLGVVAMKIAL
jgi:threonylcarbamoyladenosine tRNA methylthiotransferase CDKAL1